MNIESIRGEIFLAVKILPSVNVVSVSERIMSEKNNNGCL